MQIMIKDQDKDSGETGHTYWQWALTILANMTVFSYGLDAGWISPMAKVLQSDQSPAGEPLSDITLSWIASIICLGAVFSVPVYSWIADRFGSKFSVIAIAVPQAISWIIRLAFASGSSLIISRTFSGIAAGGCFNAVVLYVKEISQDSIRGVLGSLLILSQNIAIFVMYIMGAYLDYYTVIWIVTFVPIVTGILLLKAPETPAFLVKQGKVEEAIATLAFLRGLEKDHKIVLSEVKQMRNTNDYFNSQPEISLLNIVKNPIWRRGMLISSVIIIVQAANGAFAIVNYASSILTSTGVKFSVSVETLTLSLPALMIVGSTFCTIFVDRIGRRILNMIMLSITGCAMLCIAVSMLLPEYGMAAPAWLPVAAMAACVCAYAAGVANMPYVVMAEMFNFQIRAKILGFIVTFAWFFVFIPIVGYLPLSNAIGLHNTFFIFAGINFFGAFFSMFFQPETRGKSVEEIEQEIAKRLGLKGGNIR